MLSNNSSGVEMVLPCCCFLLFSFIAEGERGGCPTEEALSSRPALAMNDAYARAGALRLKWTALQMVIMAQGGIKNPDIEYIKNHCLQADKNHLAHAGILIT